MSDDKGFRKMSELVDALRDAERGMRGGSLGTAGLDDACNDARELYERLVVLRHKAREGAKNDVRRSEQADTAAPLPATKAGTPSIKLDTRPQDIRQTSLIEAIADSEKEGSPVMRTASEFLKEATSAAATPVPTLAEKMEKARINDLGRAISVNHKFWFTAELFNGDREAFDKAIERLNAARDLGEATTWLDAEVFPPSKKSIDPEAKAAFLELLQRRFA